MGQRRGSAPASRASGPSRASTSVPAPSTIHTHWPTSRLPKTVPNSRPAMPTTSSSRWTTSHSGGAAVDTRGASASSALPGRPTGRDRARGRRGSPPSPMAVPASASRATRPSPRPAVPVVDPHPAADRGRRGRVGAAAVEQREPSMSASPYGCPPAPRPAAHADVGVPLVRLSASSADLEPLAHPAQAARADPCSSSTVPSSSTRHHEATDIGAPLGLSTATTAGSGWAKSVATSGRRGACDSSSPDAVPPAGQPRAASRGLHRRLSEAPSIRARVEVGDGRVLEGPLGVAAAGAVVATRVPPPAGSGRTRPAPARGSCGPRCRGEPEVHGRLAHGGGPGPRRRGRRAEEVGGLAAQLLVGGRRVEPVDRDGREGHRPAPRRERRRPGAAAAGRRRGWSAEHEPGSRPTPHRGDRPDNEGETHHAVEDARARVGPERAAPMNPRDGPSVPSTVTVAAVSTVADRPGAQVVSSPRLSSAGVAG